MGYSRCSGLVNTFCHGIENDLLRLILFIIVLLVGWKFFMNKEGGGSTDLGFHTVSDGLANKDFCSGDGVYCVFEEYTWL